MKNLSIKSIVIIGLLFAPSLFASGWSGESTVIRIYAIDANRVLIKLSSFENHNNCLVNSSGHVIIDSQTHQNWFSMLLAAYMSKTTVNIWMTSECVPVWQGTSFAKVGHVMLD